MTEGQSGGSLDEIRREAEETENPSGEELPNSQIGYVRYIMEPQAQATFEEVNKDLVLSNMSALEFRIVAQYLEFFRTLARHKRTLPAGYAFLHDASVRIVGSRGKGGFASRIMATNIKETTFKDETKQNRGLLGFGFNK